MTSALKVYAMPSVHGSNGFKSAPAYKVYLCTEDFRSTCETVIEEGFLLITDDFNIYIGDGATEAMFLTAVNGGGGGASNVITGDSSGSNSTSITSTTTGTGNSVASGTDAIAIGNSATSASESIAIGRNADAANSGIAIGDNADASALTGIAIGQGSISTDISGSGIGDTIAIGSSAGAGNFRTIAIGSLADAEGQAAVAIGYESGAGQNHSVALGYQAVVLGGGGTSLSGVAIGDNADVSDADYGVAIGCTAEALADGAVAIGCDHTGFGAVSSVQDEIRLGTANHITVIEGKLVIKDSSGGGYHQILCSSGGTLSTVVYP